MAMRDCVLACHDDEACGKTCLANGNFGARASLVAVATCLSKGGEPSPEMERLFADVPADPGPK